jgi:hypothetical protein
MKATAPERITDQDHAGRGRMVVVVIEIATNLRMHAQQGQQIGGDKLGRDALRLATVGERDRSSGVSGHDADRAHRRRHFTQVVERQRHAAAGFWM